MDEPPPPPVAQAGPAAQAAGGSRYFKLGDFWPASPHAWFGIIESQFTLRNITSQQEKFGLVASVLPEASARKITHLLSSPPVDCYDAIRAAILSTHQVTEMQRMELLFNMDHLGSKRPMDLLSEMLELVKPGEEKTQLFAMLFIRRLPPQVRVQLTEDDYSDLRALAAKADRCTAFLARQSTASAISSAIPGDDGDEQSEFAVLAVSRGGQQNRFNKRGGKQQQQPRQQQQQPRQQQQQTPAEESDAPADLARLSSGLCIYHFRYGSKAWSCRQPCAWQEN